MKTNSNNTSFDEKGFEDIIRYYEQTRFDYRIAWLNEDNLAVHFGFYDERARHHAEALNNTNRVLAMEAGIKTGDQVLDAGCGKGGSCFWLAENLQATVTGISPVNSQIEECRRFAARKGLEGQTRFFQADYCATSFKSESFDVVWACESLCHAPEKAAFYQEAFRLLKPGGKIVLAEYIRQRRPLSNREEGLLQSWLKRWAIPDLDTREEHEGHARAAGFTNFLLRDYTRYTWISLKNLHKISRRWIWIGWPLRWLGVRSKVQHNNHLGGIRQFKALQQQLWFYGVITAEKAGDVRR